MRKFRSDALWFKLSPEQQKKIEHWFFVENLGFNIVHERMKKELGIQCSLSIISPMYQRLKELRSAQREAVLDVLTEIMVDSGTDPRRALTVVSSRLLQRAADKGNTGEVVALGRVILEGEARNIQRGRLKLGEDKLEFQRRLASGALFQQQKSDAPVSETNTQTVAISCNSLHPNQAKPG